MVFRREVLLLLLHRMGVLLLLLHLHRLLLLLRNWRLGSWVGLAEMVVVLARLGGLGGAWWSSRGSQMLAS